MKNNDGGPAFSCVDGVANIYQPGMSLRDYFAAKAMQAIIAKKPCAKYNSFSERDISDDMAVAYGAYFYADAMLKAREE